MSTFKSWNAFGFFQESIVSKFRYHFDDRVQEFLETVIDTSGKRIKALGPEVRLWRSQRSNESEEAAVVLPVEEEEELDELERSEAKEMILRYPVQVPFKGERMKPRAEAAFEGRVNPKGIPYLYLADDRDTAMAEMRPPLNSTLTVAEFRTSSVLKIVDCCHAVMTPRFDKTMTDEEIEAVVWGQISLAFSWPVERKDDSADYAPTQVLGELFRSRGLDGVEFRSGLGPGNNFALFDLSSADVVGEPMLYETKKIVHEFQRVVPAIELKRARISILLPDRSWIDGM